MLHQKPDSLLDSHVLLHSILTVLTATSWLSMYHKAAFDMSVHKIEPQVLGPQQRPPHHPCRGQHAEASRHHRGVIDRLPKSGAAWRNTRTQPYIHRQPPSPTRACTQTRTHACTHANTHARAHARTHARLPQIGNFSLRSPPWRQLALRSALVGSCSTPS